MLKRLTTLIAAAAALTVAAAPAAEAGGRHGKGYYRHDGGHHATRSHRYVGPRYRGHRVNRHHFKRHHTYRRSHGFVRYAGPRIIWVPTHRHSHYRHRHYRDWHRDRYYNLAILFSVLESVKTGYTHRWHDPDARVTGYVTPTRTYRLAGGQYCREYQQRIIVDGRPVEGYGRACRQPDGSWKTAN